MPRWMSLLQQPFMQRLIAAQQASHPLHPSKQVQSLTSLLNELDKKLQTHGDGCKGKGGRGGVSEKRSGTRHWTGGFTRNRVAAWDWDRAARRHPEHSPEPSVLVDVDLIEDLIHNVVGNEGRDVLEDLARARARDVPRLIHIESSERVPNDVVAVLQSETLPSDSSEMLEIARELPLPIGCRVVVVVLRTPGWPPHNAKHRV